MRRKKRKKEKEDRLYVFLFLPLCVAFFFSLPSLLLLGTEEKRGEKTSQNNPFFSEQHIRLTDKIFVTYSFCSAPRTDSTFFWIWVENYCCCEQQMMVANSFDLWQKDSFFSAAEEVQESADMYGPFFFFFRPYFYTFWLCGYGSFQLMEMLIWAFVVRIRGWVFLCCSINGIWRCGYELFWVVFESLCCFCLMRLSKCL